MRDLETAEVAIQAALTGHLVLSTVHTNSAAATVTRLIDMGVEPYLLYFGLLTGATLGGNLTPIGASANITAIGILRRNGFEVKNRDFMRIGIPFSITAVISGYILLWIIWA